MNTETNTNVNEEAKKIHETMLETDSEMDLYIKQFMEKFQDLNAFLEDIDEIVDYYFSIQTEYKDKDEFIIYLKWLLKIYVDYISGIHDEEDEELKSIIEYIEDNYDFIIYYGEDFNPIYKRINNPNGLGTRKKLTKNTKRRLISVLDL